MKSSTLTLLIGLILVCSSCAKITYTPNKPITVSSTKHYKLLNKEKAILLINKMAVEEENSLDKFIAADFKSHDKDLTDQAGNFIGYNGKTTFQSIEVVRVISDNDLVATHSIARGDTTQIRFDVFKFWNGQIVEHWSNVQDSIGVNPQGHSHTDGPARPKDIEYTDNNRKQITDFVTQCLINKEGSIGSQFNYFRFNQYIRHNPEIGDNYTGILFNKVKRRINKTVVKYTKLEKVIAEGDFVLAISEGLINDEPTVFYDLFRLEKNKIVEHWDVVAGQ